MTKKNNKKDKIKLAREVCLKNAEVLLRLAKENEDVNTRHICFHLCLLSLEEIGKSVLISMRLPSVCLNRESKIGDRRLDDHISKIYWGLWGKFLFKTEDIKKEMNFLKGLSVKFHNLRIDSLYTDHENPKEIEKRVTKKELKDLIGLVDSRIKLENRFELVDLKKEDLDDFEYFLNLLEDPLSRKIIFSKGLMEELEELGDFIRWIKGVVSDHKDNENAMLEITREEVFRKSKKGDENILKYKIKIPIESISHSVKKDTFDDFNSNSDFIKFNISEKKIKNKLSKAVIYLDLFLCKDTKLKDVWIKSLYLTRLTLVALSIASKGVFWWKPSDFKKRFYRGIEDLERSKKVVGKLNVEIEKNDVCSAGWDNERLTLRKEDMKIFQVIFGFISRGGKMKLFLQKYFFAMDLLLKSDTLFDFSRDVFLAFFDAFEETLIALGDLKDKKDLKKVLVDFFSFFENKEVNEDICVLIDKRNKLKNKENVFLSVEDIKKSKVFLDIYIHNKAVENFKLRTKNNV